jgi:hypothetical protein
MRALVGGIATGLAALFVLLAAGYIFSTTGSLEAVIVTTGASLATGALAWYEFHAFVERS